MTLAIVGVVGGVWCVLAPVVAVVLGRAIRRADEIEQPDAAARS